MGKERDSGEKTTRKIRRRYAAIRIAMEGLRGEDTIRELCRREGTAESLYYKWSKEFLDAGKARLTGDTKRQAVIEQSGLTVEPDEDAVAGQAHAPASWRRSAGYCALLANGPGQQPWTLAGQSDDISHSVLRLWPSMRASMLGLTIAAINAKILIDRMLKLITSISVKQ